MVKGSIEELNDLYVNTKTETRGSQELSGATVRPQQREEFEITVSIWEEDLRGLRVSHETR